MAIGATVAAAGAVVAVSQAQDGARAAKSHQSTVATQQPTVPDPAAVLVAAAAAAAALPDTHPRPDQFLYTRKGGEEDWLSMDGAHDGLIRSDENIPLPGCRAGLANNGASVVPCTADPAFLPDVPTTTPELSRWLTARYGSGVYSLGKGLTDLLSAHYLLPAARAALFQLLQAHAGLTATVAGVPAADVGVAWDVGGGNSTTLVFDRTSHAYVGTFNAAGTGARTGSIDLIAAVVDQVGQEP